MKGRILNYCIIGLFLACLIFSTAFFTSCFTKKDSDYAAVLNQALGSFSEKSSFEKKYFDSSNSWQSEENLFNNYDIKIKSWKFVKKEEYRELKRILVLFDSNIGEFSKWFNLEEKEGKWLLVSGLKLAESWEEISNPQLTVFSRDNSNLELKREEIDETSEYFKKIETLFNVNIPETKYYLCENGKDVSVSTGFVMGSSQEKYPLLPPLDYLSVGTSLKGIVDINNNTIYSMTIPDKQAILLLGLRQLGAASLFFRDGFSNLFLHSALKDIENKKVKDLLKQNKFIPIEKLFENKTYYNSPANINQPEAISFIGYLVDRIGIKKFVEIYPELTEDKCVKALEKVTGVNINELQDDWIKSLS